MEALTSRLFRPEAFGPVSAWGPEVFTEIGTLAGTVQPNIPGGIQDFIDRRFFCNSFLLRSWSWKDSRK